MSTSNLGRGEDECVGKGEVFLCLLLSHTDLCAAVFSPALPICAHVHVHARVLISVSPVLFAQMKLKPS